MDFPWQGLDEFRFLLNILVEILSQYIGLNHQMFPFGFEPVYFFESIVS